MPTVSEAIIVGLVDGNILFNRIGVTIPDRFLSKTYVYIILIKQTQNRYWAIRVFPLQSKRRYAKNQVLLPTIKNVTNNPEVVYDIIRFKPHKSSFLINETISMNAYEEEAR